MVEGAFILLFGMAIGYAVAVFFHPKEKPKAGRYDKYRTPDGLYSRKAVKESG